MRISAILAPAFCSIALLGVCADAADTAPDSHYVVSEERKVKIKSLIMSNLHYFKGGIAPMATPATAATVSNETTADDIGTLIVLTKDEEGQVRIGAQYLLALYGPKSLAELDKQIAAESDPDDAYFMKRTRGQVKSFMRK